MTYWTTPVMKLRLFFLLSGGEGPGGGELVDDGERYLRFETVRLM